jgi:hypothetical protein
MTPTFNDLLEDWLKEHYPEFPHLWEDAYHEEVNAETGQLPTMAIGPLQGRSDIQIVIPEQGNSLLIRIRRPLPHDTASLPPLASPEFFDKVKKVLDTLLR